MKKYSRLVQCFWLEDLQHSIEKPLESQGRKREHEVKEKSQKQEGVVKEEKQSGWKKSRKFVDEGGQESRIDRGGAGWTRLNSGHFILHQFK